MELKWDPNSNRRTGRTTRILKAMFNSKFDRCVFISKTTEMAKYHMKMFEDLALNVNDVRCPCCLRSNMEINHSRMEIYIKGKTYMFRGECYITDTNLKGLPQMDMFKDHTLFEN